MSASLFELIFLIGLALSWLIRLPRWRRRKRQPVRLNRRSGLEGFLLALIFVAMQVLPLFYLLTPWLDFADYDLPTWTGFIGAAVFGASLWLLWRSHADLGACWSDSLEIREDHRLVTRGVYGRVRHPMYAAFWLWGIAQPLLIQNWIAGLAYLAIFGPLYPVRVAREERMMLEQFGSEYRSYISQTGRVIPRLRKRGRPA